jgi:hypothetical protein
LFMQCWAPISIGYVARVGMRRRIKSIEHRQCRLYRLSD